MIKHLILLLLLQIGLGLMGCSSNDGSACPDSNCEDYATQQEAQAAFDADPDCRGDLDADNDRIACEHLPISPGGNGCPTTSSCGCSGKNKSDCGGPCCKWTTGSGCGCS